MLEIYRDLIFKTLSPEQSVYLATSEDNQPHVRPVTLVVNRERFFISTGTNDAKVRQISSNPLAEICLPLKGDGYSGYVRARGKLEQVSNNKIRAELYNETTFISKFWESPEDETLTIYQMHWESVEFLKPGDQYPVYIEWEEDKFLF